MSTIQFACPCGKTYQVPGSYAGRFGTCKTCGRRNQIPLFVDVVPLDDPVVAVMPTGRKWIVGIGATLGLLVVGIVGGAAGLSIGPNGQFDGRRFPESLQTTGALGIVASACSVFVFGPILIARRGGLSIAQWLLAFVFCLGATYVLFKIADPSSTTPSEGSAVPGALSGLAALSSIGCFLAAIVHKSRR